MKWRPIKCFLTAEEVPRWIGLSLVGVLLFGLAAVAHRGMSDARERFVEHRWNMNQRSAELLAWTISKLDRTNEHAWQRALREFTRGYACSKLRCIDSEGTINASIDIDEIGKPDQFGAELGAASTEVPLSIELPPEDGNERQWVVVPFTCTGAADATPESFYLQILFSTRPEMGFAETRTGTAVIVGIVVAVFLLVYRLMRRHFRSMSRISENLLQRRDQIEQDLNALRISDVEDVLAEQWNQLIDLMDELTSNARRASASAELKEVLQKSRKGELTDVINTVPDGLLCIVDRDQVAFANRMARRLMGIEAVEDHPMKASDLDPSDTGTKILEQIKTALSSDGNFQSLSSVVEADGGASSYRVRVLPYHARKKRGECVVTITDISQQVRADKAAEEFVAQVTHELRTPLTNIRAYAETLSSGVFDDPKVITECYNVITKETRRLSRLIEDILSMSQLEVGSIQLHIDDVDMKTLLNDAVRDLRGLADDKRIDMQLALPSKLATMRGDRDKIAVVINNLLGNALKYTPEEGTVLVGCQATDAQMMITVKDSGIGIDPADHEKIFEKFQRGTNPAVGDITGTGLGLTTALEIVRRHGGDIEVMSALGEGSTFVVRLPLVEKGARVETSVG